MRVVWASAPWSVDPAKCPRHVPSIEARALTVPGQYTNTRSSCRECRRGYPNLLIRSSWQQGG